MPRLHPHRAPPLPPRLEASLRSRLFSIALLLLLPRIARADDPTAVAKAREEFTRANEAGKKAQWAEALQAFERSAKLRPHAVTTFNIGVCQRAMGNYTLARDTLLRALTEND